METHCNKVFKWVTTIYLKHVVLTILVDNVEGILKGFDDEKQ
jgi:hypothetical protein